MTDPRTQTAPAAGSDLQDRIATLEERIAELEERMPEDRVAIVVFSGDLDRVLAAFVIATGAAAMGMQVSMFFTFWGLSALKAKRSLRGKSLMQRMMAVMSPAGTKGLPVSRMNYFGVGARMLRTMMQTKEVASLEDLMAMAREMGVTFIACEMSRDVMGVKEEELAPGFETGGAATFVGDAAKSRVTLFI